VVNALNKDQAFALADVAKTRLLTATELDELHDWAKREVEATPAKPMADGSIEHPAVEWTARMMMMKGATPGSVFTQNFKALNKTVIAVVVKLFNDGKKS
jgi:hypothetical protein